MRMSHVSLTALFQKPRYLRGPPKFSWSNRSLFRAYSALSGFNGLNYSSLSWGP